jgi:hypothetical protein
VEFRGLDVKVVIEIYFSFKTRTDIENDWSSRDSMQKQWDFLLNFWICFKIKKGHGLSLSPVDSGGNLVHMD